MKEKRMRRTESGLAQKDRKKRSSPKEVAIGTLSQTLLRPH